MTDAEIEALPLEPLRGDLTVLQGRLQKVKRLFPQYKNIHFGSDIDILLKRLVSQKD